MSEFCFYCYEEFDQYQEICVSHMFHHCDKYLRETI
jgi:hypothetical protein